MKSSKTYIRIAAVWFLLVLFVVRAPIAAILFGAIVLVRLFIVDLFDVRIVVEL